MCYHMVRAWMKCWRCICRFPRGRLQKMAYPKVDADMPYRFRKNGKWKVLPIPKKYVEAKVPGQHTASMSEEPCLAWFHRRKIRFQWLRHNRLNYTHSLGMTVDLCLLTLLETKEQAARCRFY